MSTFSALGTAGSALAAQQRALEVTGQNIANVNTSGYSRQRAELQAVGGATVPAKYAVSSGIGQGVSADTVIRIRDAFLEGRAQTESAATASLTVQDTALTQIETAFREPGPTGIQAQLSSMWAGWGDVANKPTEPGARAQVLQRTATLVAGMHATAGTLDQQWSQNRDSLATMVSSVNASAAEIADLNDAIRRATASGLPANELADKRDSLVLTLAEQVGATSAPMADGTFNVVVGGTTLVSGRTSLTLRLSGGTTQAEATADPPRLVTEPGGSTVRPGGTADGQLRVMTSIIPRYRSELDAVAQQLATTVNDAHQQGHDLAGEPGGAVFDDGVDGTGPVTAANIRLLITDTAQLAASGRSPAESGGTEDADGTWSKVSSDNENADRLYQLRLGVPGDGGAVTDGADAQYRKLIVALGVEAAVTSNKVVTQGVISTQVDAARQSVSGVSIDEEMTNMLQFQHAYQAAGRLVTAIDEMLDVLINRTGIVGR